MDFNFNKHHHGLVVGSLLAAQNIPINNVSLSTFLGEPTFIRSGKRPHITYTVHKPNIKWSSCTCVHAQREFHCKHRMEVFQLLNPTLSEGAIAHYCGSLKGTTIAELMNLMDLKLRVESTKNSGLAQTFVIV